MAAPTGSGVSAPGIDTGATATSFSIRALAGPPWELVLTDRALPYRGFKLKGGLVVETTYYPGNPVATQQVIGSNEGGATINGMWKDRFIALGNTSGGIKPAVLNGQQLGSVFDLVSEVDRFRRLGQQVRVTWGQVIRDGLLVAFEVNWLRQTDVEWSMEFAWASQGEEPGPRAAPAHSLSSAADDLHQGADLVSENAASLGVANPDPTTSASVNDLQHGTQVLSDLYTAASNTIAAPTEFVRAANGYIQNVYSAVDAMFSLVQQASDVVLGVADAARKAASIFTYVKAQYRDLEHDLDARASVYFYNVQLPAPAPSAHTAVPIAQITAGQMTYAEATARKLRKVARDQRYAAARAQATASASAAPSELLAVFVARQDQDLRRVATQFYGSPVSWVDLAVYNGLSASRLTAGQLIFVPRQLPTSPRVGWK